MQGACRRHVSGWEKGRDGQNFVYVQSGGLTAGRHDEVSVPHTEEQEPEDLPWPDTQSNPQSPTAL